MLQVPVKGDLDKALKRFKQKQARDGVPSECKKHECYMSRGKRRKEAEKEGIKNAKKRNRANRND